MMNDRGKSDRPIVPEKLPNNADNHAAEATEERGRAKGNPPKHDKRWTPSQASLPLGLERVRRAAAKDRTQRFTALLHPIYDIDRLRRAYYEVQRDAAAGMDGETWKHYGEKLEEHLRDLSGRLARGAYRAKPVRRVYIEKADGRKRPLGVPVLEDKMVQRAAVEVLNAIYEVDFVGFSYGFRPGRSPHQALDALAFGIWKKWVNWIFDADLQSFFDTLRHDWLVQFLEYRIADRRVIRLIQKWLKAGVLKMANGWSVRSVRFRVEVFHRYSPISIFTMHSTSGSNNGEPSRRTGMCWSCVSRMTSSWGSSIGRKPSGFRMS